jgi:hypothetical protein
MNCHRASSTVLGIALVICLLLSGSNQVPGGWLWHDWYVSASASQPPVVTDNVIAYAGPDGNIWTILPDGYNRKRITSGGTPQRPFIQPSWSPDGTMLAFTAGDPWSPEGIYLYRYGRVERVPNVYNCAAPAFWPDGKRLALSCARRFESWERLTFQTANADPSFGAVSATNLDGSGWQVIVPYLSDSLPSIFTSRVQRIEFSQADGAMLLNIAVADGMRRAALVRLPAKTFQELPINDDAFDNYYAVFAPNGLDILAYRCAGCNLMVPEEGVKIYSEVAGYDRNGQYQSALISSWWISLAFNASPASLSPDGQEMVYSYSEGNAPSSLFIEPLAGGARYLAEGSDPVWQPAPTIQ